MRQAKLDSVSLLPLKQHVAFCLRSHVLLDSHERRIDLQKERQYLFVLPGVDFGEPLWELLMQLSKSLWALAIALLFVSSAPLSACLFRP